MENLIQKEPNINAIYSINEPAGIGGYTAVKNAGKAGQIVIGSIEAAARRRSGGEDERARSNRHAVPGEDGQGRHRYATDFSATAPAEGPRVGIHRYREQLSPTNRWTAST